MDFVPFLVQRKTCNSTLILVCPSAYIVGQAQLGCVHGCVRTQSIAYIIHAGNANVATREIRLEGYNCGAQMTEAH